MNRSTTTDTLDSPQFDPSGLLEVFGGDREFLSEFVQVFRDQSRLLLTEMQTALEESDVRRVERSAHSLKGMLSNLGPSVALKIAGRLEVVGAYHRLDEAESLIPELANRIDLIQADLERLWG